MAARGPALEMTVPALPAAVRDARRALADCHLVGATQEATLLLLASELVSNSVRHAGLASGERIRLRAGTVRACAYVEVCDPGHSGEVPRRRDADGPVLEPGGLGLRLVDEMADRWGVSRHACGTCVWFELACGEPSELA